MSIIHRTVSDATYKRVLDWVDDMILTENWEAVEEGELDIEELNEAREERRRIFASVGFEKFTRLLLLDLPDDQYYES
jgi:hypothetical protein